MFRGKTKNPSQAADFLSVRHYFITSPSSSSMPSSIPRSSSSTFPSSSTAGSSPSPSVLGSSGRGRYHHPVRDTQKKQKSFLIKGIRPQSRALDSKKEYPSRSRAAGAYFIIPCILTSLGQYACWRIVFVSQNKNYF